MKKLALILCLLFIFSCTGGDTLPKPSPFLTLKYPTPSYLSFQSNCPYQFEISNQATIKFEDNCWAKISYPKLKATIHITYREVDNNLNDILKEVEKLTFEHTIKADAINAYPYENFEKRVFAKLYNVEGNVATNIQFRITDSVKNVLAGSLYFYATPNFDSIKPAVEYIKKDIIHLVETVEWITNDGKVQIH